MKWTDITNKKLIPLEENNPNHHPIPVEYIEVNGRKEHEAIIKDSQKCKDLNIDQDFEIMVYLNRWGDWLDKEMKNE